MTTRRDCLAYACAAGAAASLPTIVSAQPAGVITRTIPGTSEALPIIGLGSSATFSQLASNDEIAPLRDVFSTLLDAGCSVFDTAPSYGRGSSEEVAGRIAADLGATDRIFWATKVNVARGGGADEAAARAQIADSFELLRADPIDLIQVHNLGDMPTQLGILKELKEEGRVRYIGATTTRAGDYGELANWMRNEPLDFIGIDYAVDNLAAADAVLPLAADRGIGVLVYVPFGRSRLFARVGDRQVPEFAQEFGATSWAQFFLKFAAAHPAVTVVTPATSQAHHMLDNAGAALGRLPDAAEQRRMIEFVDSLPQA